jgi:hypothetical protein
MSEYRVPKTAEEKAAAFDRLYAVIVDCHSQRGDDRCWMDVLKIYEGVGLPHPDTSVGDKDAMLANCGKFVKAYCAGGKWKSYADVCLENECMTMLLLETRGQLDRLVSKIDQC